MHILNEIFLSEILKPFSMFYSGCLALVFDLNEDLPVEWNNFNLDSDLSRRFVYYVWRMAPYFENNRK